MLNKIQYSQIKKYKRYIPFDVNRNSKLYLEKDLIHKIPYWIDREFSKTLYYVSSCNIDELIEIRNLIFKKENLVGYSFTNYKDYKSLGKQKNRSLKLKLEDCVKIISAFNKLNEKGIQYRDFHIGNVLLNPKTGDIKICDVDSINIHSYYDFTKTQLEKALILSIAYLYNLDFYNIYMLLNYREPINRDGLISECIDCISVDKIYELFQKIDLDMIPYERKKIKIKSKDLIEDRYYTKNIF